MMAVRGRPTNYSEEVAAKLCEELAQGKSLRTVCAKAGMPAIATVFLWFRSHPDFLEQYTRAKQESADAMAEEILYISDHTKTGTIIVTKDNGQTELRKGDMLAHRKLQIDTRKFLMAKMKPKRYGDKLDLTTDGEKLPAPISTLPIKDAQTE